MACGEGLMDVIETWQGVDCNMTGGCWAYNRWNSTKSAEEWLTIILEIWWLIWHISGEHMPGGQAPKGRVVIKMHLFIRRGVISWLDCSFNVSICWKIVKMSKWLIGRLWFSHKKYGKIYTLFYKLQAYRHVSGRYQLHIKYIWVPYQLT